MARRPSDPISTITLSCFAVSRPPCHILFLSILSFLYINSFDSRASLHSVSRFTRPSLCPFFSGATPFIIVLFSLVVLVVTFASCLFLPAPVRLRCVSSITLCLKFLVSSVSLSLSLLVSSCSALVSSADPSVLLLAAALRSSSFSVTGLFPRVDFQHIHGLLTSPSPTPTL